MSDSGLYVIGDENAVFGFGLVGVEGQAAHSAEEAHRFLQRALARQAWASSSSLTSGQRRCRKRSTGCA